MCGLVRLTVLTRLRRVKPQPTSVWRWPTSPPTVRGPPRGAGCVCSRRRPHPQPEQQNWLVSTIHYWSQSISDKPQWFIFPSYLLKTYYHHLDWNPPDYCQKFLLVKSTSSVIELFQLAKITVTNLWCDIWLVKLRAKCKATLKMQNLFVFGFDCFATNMKFSICHLVFPIEKWDIDSCMPFIHFYHFYL